MLRLQVLAAIDDYKRYNAMIEAIQWKQASSTFGYS